MQFVQTVESCTNVSCFNESLMMQVNWLWCKLRYAYWIIVHWQNARYSHQIFWFDSKGRENTRQPAHKCSCYCMQVFTMILLLHFLQCAWSSCFVFLFKHEHFEATQTVNFFMFVIVISNWWLTLSFRVSLTQNINNRSERMQVLKSRWINHALQNLAGNYKRKCFITASSGGFKCQGYSCLKTIIIRWNER